VTSIVRVSADGRVDVVVGLSKLDCTLEGVTVRIACTYVEDKIHFRVAASIDNLFPITIKLRAIHMSV
jgi:hypothetical protein